MLAERIPEHLDHKYWPFIEERRGKGNSQEEILEILELIEEKESTPMGFLFHGREFKDLEVLKLVIKNDMPSCFYSEAKNLDKEQTTKIIELVKKTEEKYKYDTCELIGHYGLKIIPYIKRNQRIINKIPRLPQQYADKIKEHLTKKNTGKIIKLVEILAKQGAKPEEINITKENRIKNLQKQVTEKYGKEVKIKEPAQAIMLHDLVNNKKIKGVLEQIIANTYEPKEVYKYEKQYRLKKGKITIKLDSENKIEQARLLEAMSSCMHIINGSYKTYSQEYISTNGINFAGIYDEHKNRIGRFTVVINPEQKRTGITSKLYKKTKNKLRKQVKDWLKGFAEEYGFKTGGRVKLPIKKFYDDIGRTSKGKIRTKKRFVH